MKGHPIMLQLKENTMNFINNITTDNTNIKNDKLKI
jgi:hypothetical protein